MQLVSLVTEVSLSAACIISQLTLQHVLKRLVASRQHATTYPTLHMPSSFGLIAELRPAYDEIGVYSSCCQHNFLFPRQQSFKSMLREQ